MMVLLLAGSALGVAGLLVFVAFALVAGARLRVLVLAGVAGAWIAVYGAALLATSLASREATLPVGETKYFCGFYLDCHIGVAVLADSVVPAIGNRRAAGAFHVVTLRFASSARQATLAPWDVRLEIVGADGARFVRDRAAEAMLGLPAALEREIPAGGDYRVRVVFDVPASARDPRLFADQGPPFKVPEVLLIGDEASLLHHRTMLALPQPGV